MLLYLLNNPAFVSNNKELETKILYYYLNATLFMSKVIYTIQYFFTMRAFRFWFCYANANICFILKIYIGLFKFFIYEFNEFKTKGDFQVK